MSQSTIHLAYADDHKVVRDAIVTVLKSIGGFAVDIAAKDGKDLIEQLDSATRLPDVCLLDVSMPVMNGFEALEEMQIRWPQIKVLAFTISSCEHHIIRMIRNGAKGYLLKTCELNELKEAIISIHQKGVYFSKVASSHFQNAIKQNLIALPNLTEKEAVLLKYSCSDLSYAEIAVIMKTTRRSVEGYRDSLFRKLNVNSRVSLALYAVQSGLVALDILGVG